MNPEWSTGPPPPILPLDSLLDLSERAEAEGGCGEEGETAEEAAVGFLFSRSSSSSSFTTITPPSALFPKIFRCGVFDVDTALFVDSMVAG